MEYQKTNVNSFLGLDNNLRPELIKNEEASDIENLRFEKLGYLVNRNGVAGKSIYSTRNLTPIDFKGTLWSIGTMGLTEYVIEKPWGVGSGTTSWAPYDDATLNAYTPTIAGSKHTDRFMVYALRIPAKKPASGSSATDANNESAKLVSGFPDETINRYTWRYKAAYLLVPLTGPTDFKDQFAFAPNGNVLNPVLNYDPRDYSLPTLYSTIGARTINRADDKPSKLQIYAPARWLGVHNTFSDGNIPKDLNWIEHYVSMQQYRDSVVISDMTNGDMYLVDEYSESEYNEVKKHRFSLRENSLAKFDIDDVVVDFGIGGNNFNEGVEAPMALYKFYLTRSRLQQTQDNYIQYYSSEDASPRIEQFKSDLRYWNLSDNISVNPSVFIATEFWKGNEGGDNYIHACAIRFDTQKTYIFSSSAEASEYDNLFAPLTLQNPDIDQDDQVATDIYLWKDMPVKYFPVSGISSLYGQYLTSQDRTWNKTSSAGTKLIKLKTHEGIEQQVPLGVWRYRFVWYMGNGEYSAPSSELITPDILFSGIKDADIISAIGTYKRPIGLSSYPEAEQTSVLLSTTSFINKSSRMQGVAVFDALGNLTSYGSNFVKIKQALFDANHVFAAKYSSTLGATWPSSWSAESLLAKGQVGVICAMMWQNDFIPLNCVIAETAYTDLDYENKYGSIEYKKTNDYKSSSLPLIVPLFSDEQNSATYNSVFTNYGVIRTSYQNTVRNPGNPADAFGNTSYNISFPSYEIVFEGVQRYGAGDDANGNDGKGYVGSEVISNGKRIWFNMIPYHGGVSNLATNVITDPPLLVELNNFPDDSNVAWGTPPQKYWAYRNMTVVRGVRKESDRVLFIKPSIPTEVASRMILSGLGEIPLCDFGDLGTWNTQKQYAVLPSAPTYGYERMQHSVERVFRLVSDTLITGAFDYRSLFSYANPFTVVVKDYRRFIYAPGLAATTSTLSFSNLRVVLAGKGERLTIPEQLSMYVPASLLFEAPHVKIVVPSNRIPRRARQLLIFRTRASHDNAWQPHEYGLVKTIDIIRDGTTGLPTGAQATKIEFLDDVKSSELDYSYSVPDYDGFTNPIKSRFCLPLNERVFYANIKESYKPHSPRNAVKIETTDPTDTTVVAHKNLNVGSNTELERLWSYRLVVDGSAPTNIPNRYLYYFAAYNDQARSYSLASYSGQIDRGATLNNKVVMYGLPSAYDPAIEQVNIYRLNTPAPLSTVAFTGRRSTNTATVGNVYFVAQGIVEYNGVVYYPNSVIQAFHGGDVGYDGTRMNFFWNYFDTPAPALDRGLASSYCQPIILDITGRYDEGTGPQWIEKIGTIKPEDEGIFYDNDLPSIGRLPIKQFFQNEDDMPAGLRWSEPYQPNKIKLPSLMEVRAGDGDQITGLAMLYGNLIVLKERSIHRLAVQGSQVPVSRVDEISNNVGCIAPNTVITVNNTLYFLSWAGFYKYDNNVLSKVDGKFSEELQLRLRSAQNGVMNPAIRDASCGWNPTYRELYLTLPVMTTSNNEGDVEGANTSGITITDNKGLRQLRGITYAINIDSGLATKYRYMDDATYFTDPLTWMQQLYSVAPTQRAPRVYSRLYYTNTLGQLRSAETLPPRTKNYLLPFVPSATEASMEFMRISMFIESPTKVDNNLDKPNDDYLMFTYNPITLTYQITPVTKFVRVFWSSKDWTAEDKTVLKRIRKVFAYIAASDDPVILRGVVHTSPMGETATTDTAWQYGYVDTRPASPRFNYSVTGEIMAVPTESAGQSTSPSQNRGERHTFNVEGSGSFQMEYFGFYWKPINQYER
jgi:hypothetical protein